MLTYRRVGVPARDDDNEIVSALKRALPEVPAGLTGGASVELGIRAPSGAVYRVVVVARNEEPTALAVLRGRGLIVRSEGPA